MSDHTIPIIEIGELHPHPNADRLVLTTVGGWQVVVGCNQFEAGDRAIYIPPDFTVDVARPEFAFLANKTSKDRMRIRVAKLRGEISQGLLIPLPDEIAQQFELGDDVSKALDIQRYEPPLDHNSPERATTGPALLSHKFDIENYQRYSEIFLPGERLIVTEKIHGANTRFVYYDERLHVGSRTEWWEDSPTNIYWKALRSAGDGAIELAKALPDTTIYGEAYGRVQKLKYDADPGEVRLAIFAAMRTDGSWVDTLDLRAQCESAVVAFVPVLDSIINDAAGIERAKALAEENSSLASHMREGVVLVPQSERKTDDGERVALKLVSNRYLMKS